MTDICPEYVVLTERDGVHLVVIRYGEGLPWLRVVAAFPNKDRADSYADLENTFVDEEMPSFSADLKYETPPHDEPASVLPKFIGAKAVPALLVEPVKRDAEIRPESKAAAQRIPAHADQHAERCRIIRELWPTWATGNEIGARTGLSGSRVSQIAHQLGLPPRTKNWFMLRKAALKQANQPISETEAQRGQADEPPAPAREGDEPAASDQETLASASGAVQARSEATAPPTQEPASAPEPEPAPVPTSAPANGYASAGKLIVETDGIMLREHEIAFGVRAVEITESERRALQVILRAHPSAVGMDWVRKRAWPSERVQDGEFALSLVCKGLCERLPEIGLELCVEKGVGLHIRAMEAQAA